MNGVRRFLAASTTPRSSPVLGLLYALGASFVFHLLLVFMIGMEADTSGEVVCAVILAAGGMGLFSCKLGHGLLFTMLAAAWPSALFGWRRWYWSMDMHPPGGAAQALVALTGWIEAPAPLALAAVAAAASLPGWLLMRFDRWNEKRTGRSMFDED
jgi:hypothetical protein